MNPIFELVEMLQRASRILIEIVGDDDQKEWTDEEATENLRNWFGDYLRMSGDDGGYRVRDSVSVPPDDRTA